MLIDPSLARHTAFLLWKFVPHPKGPDRKPLKMPVHPDGVTVHSLKSPARPMTAAEALERAAATGCGVGFRPAPGMGLACLDLDGAIEDDEITERAQPLVDFFAGALLEVSASGRGLHLWFSYTGEGPGRRGQVDTPVGPVELYSDNQFIALGRAVSGSANQDCTAQMNWVLANYFPARPAEGPVLPADWEGKSDRERAECLEDLRSALQVLDLSGYDAWVKAGQNLACLGETGLDLWDEASARAEGYDGRMELERKWATFSGDRSDYRSIFARAQRAGWEQPRRVVTVSPLEAFGGPVALPAEASTDAPPASFMAASDGAIPATPANVVGALRSAESGIRLGFDEFKGAVCLGHEGAWRELHDEDYMRLRVSMEQRGFKAIPHELIRAAVGLVASENRFDSAIEWGNSLKWDGVQRIDTSLSDYFGAPRNAYTESVARYLWTALAGRLLVPGLQADMAVILVGLQGAGKTTVISSIAPTPDTTCEVDLSHKDEVISRILRGKLVGEIAEMKGLQGRQAESTKAFISRRIEAWIPKYKESEQRFPRRCIFIGSANSPELLEDVTGERRWLPIELTGRAWPEKLRAVREQLWAEGIARFRQGGIAWQEAEERAKAEHKHFKVRDEREDIVRAWLAAPAPHVPGTPLDDTPQGEKPFSVIDVATGALGFKIDRVGKAEQMVVARILKGLGYERGRVYEGGVRCWRWAKR